MMNLEEIWAGQQLTETDRSVDHGIFSGLMRRPDYLKHLEHMLLNPSIFIEITSNCNFFCSYCHSAKSSRPKGYMREELFRHIVDQLPSSTKNSVALYVDGEPTLHNKFKKYVSILNERNIPVHIASNGSNLRAEFLDLKMKLVTYLSTSAEEFAQRSKIDFTSYVGRISDYLREWRARGPAQSIDLRVYCPNDHLCDRRFLQPKIDFALKLLQQAGLDTAQADPNANIFFRHVNSSGGVLTFGVVPIGTGGLFPGKSERDGDASALRKNFGFCDSAWQRMIIYWDGSTALCCQALQGETRYAGPEDIWRTPLRDLWLNHDNAKTFRERMLRGELILPGCIKCLSRFPSREFYINGSSYTPMYEISPSEAVSFDGNPEARTMLLSGFAVMPLNIAWTNSERSEFGFRVPRDADGELALRIKCMVFAPEQLGANQFVDVKINGVLESRLALRKTQAEIYTLKLPRLVPGQDGYRVQLLFSERRSPAELGIGQDVRKLGLGIHALTIVAAP